MAYETENNLQKAFGGESQANRRYKFFAEKAEKEGSSAAKPKDGGKSESSATTDKTSSTGKTPGKKKSTQANKATDN